MQTIYFNVRLIKPFGGSAELGLFEVTAMTGMAMRLTTNEATTKLGSTGAKRPDRAAQDGATERPELEQRPASLAPAATETEPASGIPAATAALLADRFCSLLQTGETNSGALMIELTRTFLESAGPWLSEQDRALLTRLAGPAEVIHPAA